MFSTSRSTVGNTAVPILQALCPLACARLLKINPLPLLPLTVGATYLKTDEPRKGFYYGSFLLIGDALLRLGLGAAFTRLGRTPEAAGCLAAAGVLAWKGKSNVQGPVNNRDPVIDDNRPTLEVSIDETNLDPSKWEPSIGTAERLHLDVRVENVDLRPWLQACPHLTDLVVTGEVDEDSWIADLPPTLRALEYECQSLRYLQLVWQLPQLERLVVRGKIFGEVETDDQPNLLEGLLEAHALKYLDLSGCNNCHTLGLALLGKPYQGIRTRISSPDMKTWLAFVAAGDRNFAVLEELLDSGVKVSATNRWPGPWSEGGETFLEVVHWYKDDSRLGAAVDMLIRKGLDVNATGFRGRTELLNATFDHRVDYIQFLVSRGAAVEVKNYRESPLWWVAQQSCWETREDYSLAYAALREKADFFGCSKEFLATCDCVWAISEKDVEAFKRAVKTNSVQWDWRGINGQSVLYVLVFSLERADGPYSEPKWSEKRYQMLEFLVQQGSPLDKKVVEKKSFTKQIARTTSQLPDHAGELNRLVAEMAENARD